MTTFQIGEREIALLDIDCVHIGVCTEILIFMKSGEAHRLDASNEKLQLEAWDNIKAEFEKTTFIACADTLYRPEAIFSFMPTTRDGELYTEVLLRSGHSIRRRYDDELARNEDLEQFMSALTDTQLMRSTAYAPPTLN